MRKNLLLLTAFAALVLATGTVYAQPVLKKKPERKKIKSSTKHTQFKKPAVPLPDSSLFYLWNNSSFDLDRYEVYTYDGDGNVTMEITKTPAGTPEWRTDYAYTATGDIVRSVDYEYNTGTSDWEPQYKDEYVYNDKGRVVSYTYYEYDPISMVHELVEGDSLEYTFDVSNRVISKVYLVYVESSLSWENTYKADLGYTGAATAPSSIVFYEWNSTDQQWEAPAKADNIKWEMGYTGISYFEVDDYFEFDIDPTVHTAYDWDGNNWTPLSYDSSAVSNGHVDLAYSFEWNGSSFDPTDRTTYTYDARGNRFSELGERFDNNGWGITSGFKDSCIYGAGGEVRVSYRSNYDGFTQAWKYTAKTEHFFATMGIQKNALDIPVSLYPNPATHSITLENNSNAAVYAKIFSAQGTEVLSVLLQEGKNSLPVSGWQSGIYLVRLESGAAVSTRKIMIR